MIGVRPSAPEPLLRCERLVVGHEGRAVLPPVDLAIRPASLWAVIGRNGAGKTTWMRTVLGLLPPVSGAVHLLPEARPGYVPQRVTFDPLYPLRADEVVELGMLRGAWGGSAREARRRAHEALASVDLADRAGQPFRELSEGQKQRVLLARLLASGARIALLDEPTAAMDPVAEAATLSLLARLRDEHGISVVVVTHRMEAVRSLADRALLLDPTLPAAVVGPPDEVLGHPAVAERLGPAFRSVS